MAKYKPYDYSQQVLIPVSLEDQLMPGTLEFAIHTLVETRMDTGVFDGRFRNDETGRKAYDPKVLVKIVLFGYSRGLITSRKLERACKENVTFMALSCGLKPDHSTIAAFVSSMKEEIVPLFRDVLLVCEQEGLLGGTFFALDGCKLPSNASRSMSGKISDLRRKKAKIEKKVERLVEQQLESDKKDEDTEGEKPTDRSNRDKQIERLEKRAKRIEGWLKENSPKIGKQGREILSNVTDNDSGSMASCHGMIQGYNAQALVDSKHQVILHGEVFGGPEDHYVIPSVLDGAKKNMEAIGQGEGYFSGTTFTADSSYHSPTNLKKCEKEKLDAYIPDKRFRKRDSRFQGKKRGRPSTVDQFTDKDFQRDEKADEYICPAGKSLQLIVKSTEQNGIIYRRYATKKKDCSGCKLKFKCFRHKKAKRKTFSIAVGYTASNLSKAMGAKIDSETGQKIYSRRIAIVEPVFANIRAQKGMNRFTLRSKIKVNIQWLLYCMVHNIEKILGYGAVYGLS
jgi:transposase